MTTSDNISAIEAIEKAMEKATPGVWDVWEEQTPNKADAIAEMAYQVENSDPFVEVVYLLNADGKCPATTGCGPTSAANAAYISACSPERMRSILAEARKAHEELAVARSVHRWNVDRYGENLAVCRNEHEKGDPCEWETFVPLARAEAAEDRVAELETALDRAPDGRHFDILAEALAEVKATSDGKSDQSIADIVAGCLDEIAALPPRRARTLLNGGSDAQG